MKRVIFSLAIAFFVSLAFVSAACDSLWICDEWSSCTEGMQKRTCTDANTCGAGDTPLLERSCGVEPTPQESIPPEFSPSSEERTAFLFRVGAGVLIIIFFVLFVAFYRHYRMMHKRHELLSGAATSFGERISYS